jgi:formate dehydrogenase maturation protein FdhE
VGEVIPPLEDIGTLHLDVLAQNEGYKREEVGIGLS